MREETMRDTKMVSMNCITGKFSMPLYDGKDHTVFGVDTETPYIKAGGYKIYLNDGEIEQLRELQKSREAGMKAFRSLNFKTLL